MPNVIVLLLPLLSILALLAILVGAFVIFTAKRPTATAYPYEKEPSLFSRAERSFLGVLEQAVGDEYRILGKVRLADIIRVRRGMSNSARQSAFNRIQSKHLDFVACDRNDLSVQFVVELDDSSHARAKRRDRDAFVNKALAASGVPLFRFPARRAYSVQEIRNRILNTKQAGANQPVDRAAQR